LVLHSIPHHMPCEALTEHADGCTSKRQEVKKAWDRIVGWLKDREHVRLQLCLEGTFAPVAERWVGAVSHLRSSKVQGWNTPVTSQSGGWDFVRLYGKWWEISSQ
jgi:hypothetical protein